MGELMHRMIDWKFQKPLPVILRIAVKLNGIPLLVEGEERQINISEKRRRVEV